MQAGEVEVKGWEVELSGSPLANLQMSLGYARLDTSYLSHQTLAGTPFTLFEPRHSLKGYVNYRLGGGQWSVGGGVQITSGVIGTGAAGTREEGGYGVASLQVGYKISPQTSVSLAVNNAFDRKYYSRVGGLNSYNTYGDPRNAMLTLRTRF
ncbi:Fe(3+)-pyochelin receptor precursor [compost metagenome]